MWFIFGFITLLSFSIYFGYKRLNAAWTGEKGVAKGVSYQYKVLESKQGIAGLLIGIDGPPVYDYAFKSETSTDRFFKSIGLSVEHQIGSKEFDDLVYVVSDNAHLHRQISSNEKIIKTVIKIFRSSETFNCEVEEIRNNSGRLWVKYKTTSGFDEYKISELSSKIVNLLKIIADELEHTPQSSISKWKDPFVIKAAIILAISTGLAINGLSHLMRLTWTTIPFTVDSNLLLIKSAYWGAGIIITLLVASITFLGRSARTHLVMIELILIGTFGAVTTAFAELRDINMELDKSVAAIYDVKTHDKRISKSRRSPNYYLYLNDWNNQDEIKKVEVSSGFFDSVSIGDNLVIKQKSGYLNFRWVERVEKKI